MLKEGDILTIRRRIDSGEMLKKIATSYGVSGEHIRQIKIRKVWTHLP